jgi:hypothetical protein
MPARTRWHKLSSLCKKRSNNKNLFINQVLVITQHIADHAPSPTKFFPSFLADTKNLLPCLVIFCTIFLILRRDFLTYYAFSQGENFWIKDPGPEFFKNFFIKYFNALNYISRMLVGKAFA